MFIKLSFSADKKLTACFRIITDIINTPSVTSVSALQARFTSAGYSSTVTSGFDATNSQIIRTVDTANTVAHYASYSNGQIASSNFIWTVRQQVYDTPSTKYYMQLNSQTISASSTPVYMTMGDSIVGDITAGSMAVSVSESLGNNTGAGTQLTVGGTPLAFTNQIAYSTSGATNVRTIWMYITDKTVMWATTNTSSFNSGFGTTYASPTNYSGPFFFSQYTRYDYHNNDGNGIIPVMYSSPRGAGIGFGTSDDLTTVQNYMYTSNSTTMPLRVYNLVSATPQVGSAWPKIYNPYVAITMNGRSNSIYAFNVGQAAGTVSSPNSPSTGSAISTTASARFTNATLTGTGFGMIPLGWENTWYGNHGGNMSDQSGVFIFNGDYAPGDTFIANNKMYMIWPMYSGYSNRVGLAIPME